MEFASNGDLYFLRKGDYRYVYMATQPDINNGDGIVTVSLVSAMFGNNIPKKLSITRNGVNIVLTAETSVGSATSVYNISTVNGSLTGIATYSVPNSGTSSISTYYYNGDLYLVRNAGTSGTGTLYVLNVAFPAASPSVGTVNTESIHDMTFGGTCN